MFSFGGYYRCDHIHHSGPEHRQANCAEFGKIVWTPVSRVRSGSPMKGDGTKVGRKQEEAVIALLTQGNMEAAARSVGIATKTLLRWHKHPEFQTAYREARRAAFGQSIARLQQGSSAATTTLLKLMVDPNTPAATRARAADSVLNHAIRATETEDFEVRLSELERNAKVEQHNRGGRR